MAYELINHGPATPHRIHACLKLLARLENANRTEVINLLQPEALGYDQKVPQDTVEAVSQLGFLYSQEAQKPDALKLRPDAYPMRTVDEFRAQMQARVLGKTSEAQPNFLFNIFTAWYATQDERVLSYSGGDMATQFNKQLSLDRTDRAFNTTKLPAWKTWSRFLGLCWPLKVPNLDEVYIPNAYGRLSPLIPELLTQPGKLIDLGTFLSKMRELCPELDSGTLFEQCWHASRGAEQRGNRLSLMLSNALRQLHDSGILELVDQADAINKWSLYKATGHPIQQVTHLKRRSN